MNHFLEASQLTVEQIENLLQRAFYFKQQRQYPNYPGHRMANLFYENSTRTRVSFEIAAQQLSIPSVNLDLASSSESKGEILSDTIANLAAMGIDLYVIRHKQEGVQQRLANEFGAKVRIINAGDGKHAHPSQAMLDLMTIIEQKPDLTNLKIAIVGNLRHSRVANSLQCLFSLMKVGDLWLVAPKIWSPAIVHYGRVTHSLEEGIEGADVIICLRVQNERLADDEQMSTDIYRQQYGITQKTLVLAKPDAMIMHPGPINRGVELDSEVADGLQSCILGQVANGVFMRMAIIESLIV